MWPTGSQVITIDPADFTTGALMGQIPYETQVGFYFLSGKVNSVNGRAQKTEDVAVQKQVSQWMARDN